MFSNVWEANKETKQRPKGKLPAILRYLEYFFFFFCTLEKVRCPLIPESDGNDISLTRVFKYEVNDSVKKLLTRNFYDEIWILRASKKPDKGASLAVFCSFVSTARDLATLTLTTNDAIQLMGTLTCVAISIGALNSITSVFCLFSLERRLFRPRVSIGTHGRRKEFSRGSSTVNFSRGGISGEISFYPLKIKRASCCWKLNKKLPNLKITGGSAPPSWHPPPTPMLEPNGECASVSQALNVTEDWLRLQARALLPWLTVRHARLC